MEPSWDNTASAEEVYGGVGGMAKAFTAGAGRGASFGLSDQALARSGSVSPEALKGLEETNPISSGLGEIAGIIGPALLGDEAVWANLPKAVAKMGGRATELAESKGAGKIASETIGRATEGAMYGAGQSVSENALGDHDLISEKTLANMGLSAAFLGGVPPLVGQSAKMAGKALSSEYMAKGLEYLSAIEKIKNPIKLITGTGVVDTVSGAIKKGEKLIKALDPEQRAKLKTIINLGNEAGEADKSITDKIKAFMGENKDSVISKGVSKLLSGADFDEEEKNIVDSVMNAPHLENKFDENMAGLDQHTPNISAGMKAGYIRGMQFLNSKLPQRPMDAFGSRPELSQSDIQKFNRYRSVVENPISALDQLKDRTLSSETLEALSAVYPKLFESMRQTLVNQLAARKTQSIPFQTRQLISQFLGEPMDRSMQPYSIMANQTLIANSQKATQPQMKPRAKGLDKMDRAGRSEADYGAMDERV